MRTDITAMDYCDRICNVLKEYKQVIKSSYQSFDHFWEDFIPALYDFPPVFQEERYLMWAKLLNEWNRSEAA